MPIKVKPEKLEYYKELHANPWPEVNAMLKECNIQNYSIYYRDGLLFSYLEYTGDDFDADMKKMAADPTTQKWWKEMQVHMPVINKIIMPVPYFLYMKIINVFKIIPKLITINT